MKKMLSVWVVVLAISLIGCESGKKGSACDSKAAGPNKATCDNKAVAIFDGKTLNGWKQLSGKATYKVVDGTIEGTTAGQKDDENAFLCTIRNYGDFILDADLKISGLNSGIQIRSESTPDFKNGRVHGYQVEVDESSRAWSGGIYDEARRLWINNLTKNEAARKAFKKDDWNHYHIEAMGDSIKTWVNGVQATDLVDSMTLEGFIGLQVHSSSNAGRKVYWKNIKIADLGKHVWSPIFDGKSLAGWKTIGKGDWQVVDGAIKGVVAADAAEGSALVLETPKSDYTVRLNFKAVKGAGAVYLLAGQADSPAKLSGLNAGLDSNDTAKGGMSGALSNDGTVLQPPYPGEEKDWPMKDWQQFKTQDWNQLTISAHGNRIVLHVNDHKTAEIKDYAGAKEGRLAIWIKGGQEGEFWFKDINLLTPEKK